MLSESLIMIIGALASLLFGSSFSYIEKIFSKYPNIKLVKLLVKLNLLEIKDNQSYKERIQQSINSLEIASNEVDKFLLEIKSISAEKQKTIEDMESQLDLLSKREIEMKSKVKALEDVPLEAVKYFEDILNKGNKRSEYRDYLLFGLGVLVTTIITIVLNYFNK